MAGLITDKWWKVVDSRAGEGTELHIEIVIKEDIVARDVAVEYVP